MFDYTVIVSNRKYLISSIILLLIIPIIGVQSFAEESIMFTDQSNYNYGDTVTVFGTSQYPSNLFTFSFSNLDGEIGYDGQSIIDSEGNFEFTPLGLILSVGNYTVSASMPSSSLIVNFIVHDAEPLLELNTDKEEYHNSEDIILSGISPADPNVSTAVDVKLSYPNGTEISSYYTHIESDGTFTGTIPTTGEFWDNHNGFLIINATIQDYYNTAVINYYNTPDISNEVLDDRITDLDDTLMGLNIFIMDLINTITIQNNTISSLEEVIAGLLEQHLEAPPEPPILAPIGPQEVAENDILNFIVTATDVDLDSLSFSTNATLLSFGEFNDGTDGTASIQFNPGFTDAGIYPINVSVTDGVANDDETFLLNVTNTSQAPIIIELIANDPDNGDDVYSVGDTITICHDSPTNTPGGIGNIQRMPQFLGMFTPSESFGTAGFGTWLNSTCFEFTSRNTNDALISINSTTVTPALETLILPADNNEEDFSTVTSPVLGGNFGTPVQ